uniref:Uncharacterized protein n=1 Tax=Salarias fasciatus TaxID=181472 RepID=A0A672IVB4_SALFA
MTQDPTAGRRSLQAFFSGLFVAVSVTVAVLKRFTPTGSSMGPTPSAGGLVSASLLTPLQAWKLQGEVRKT